VPRRAIALSAVVVLALAAFAIGSGGRQEAYQLLLSAAGILFGATYVVMFSLPLFGARALGLPRGWLLRICALLGFGISIAFTSISIFPIGDVPSPFAFAGRVLAIVTALVLPGLILATRVKRRGRVRAPEPDR
jgi:hypothetical protein